jgi:hypothetical protein
MRSTRPSLDAAALPVTFAVGSHSVVVAPKDRHWSVSVDGTVLTGFFATEAEAWEAGVREADRLDRRTGG